MEEMDLITVAGDGSILAFSLSGEPLLDLVSRDELISSFCKVRMMVRRCAQQHLAFYPTVPMPTFAGA